MKVSVYVATTLDGFIAREDGALDWLPGSDGTIDPALEGEDYGYQSFMNSVDILVMGRNTFELVHSFGEWPYDNKEVIVLSSSLTQVPKALPDYVSLKAVPPEVLYEKLKQAGAKHIYVDGGQTIQRFLRAGLIDEITITTVPVLIGKGIPLFDGLSEDINLHHLTTRTFINDLVQTKYSVEKITSKGVS